MYTNTRYKNIQKSFLICNLVFFVGCCSQSAVVLGVCDVYLFLEVIFDVLLLQGLFRTPRDRLIISEIDFLLVQWNQHLRLSI